MGFADQDEPLEALPPTESHFPSADDDLVERLRTTETALRRHLDDLARNPLRRFSAQRHPVRVKNLEKAAGFLQSIAAQLESREPPPSPEGTGDSGKATSSAATREPRRAPSLSRGSLTVALDLLDDPGRLSFAGAWELADRLELLSIAAADAPTLQLLLLTAEAEPEVGGGQGGPRLPPDHLKRLRDGCADGTFKDAGVLAQARRALEFLHEQRVAEFRRDRAKVQLRGYYLVWMALILAALVAGVSLAYLYAARRGSDGPGGWAFALVALGGAAGSVLSRAVKLGKQPLHREAEASAPEPPLGVRALLSGWKVFFAQIVIGATAGVILYLVLAAGIVRLGNGDAVGPAALVLVAFLAGFSEPFFFGILDRVAGQAGMSER